MKTLNKSWSLPASSSKKFLSRLLTHHLSRQLDNKKYEVVYEGSLDLFNPVSEEPDLVVYTKGPEFSPVVAIEICKKDDVWEMTIQARQLLERYSLEEFFVYDYETPCWYRLKSREQQVLLSSRSLALSTNLDDIVYLDPAR